MEPEKKKIFLVWILINFSWCQDGEITSDFFAMLKLVNMNYTQQSGRGSLNMQWQQQSSKPNLGPVNRNQQSFRLGSLRQCRYAGSEICSGLYSIWWAMNSVVIGSYLRSAVIGWWPIGEGRWLADWAGLSPTPCVWPPPSVVSEAWPGKFIDCCGVLEKGSGILCNF